MKFLNKYILFFLKGWQYALDFPRTYYSKQSKTSCVRRRLWSRYYRFDGYGRWIKVSTITVLLLYAVVSANINTLQTFFLFVQ